MDTNANFEERAKTELITLIKALGQDLIDHAEELAGDPCGDLITSLDVSFTINFPMTEVPVWRVNTEYACKNWLKELREVNHGS